MTGTTDTAAHREAARPALVATTVRFHGDDAMLVDESLLIIGLDDERETIEALQQSDDSLTGRQLNRHRLVGLQGLKQEPVLNVDGRLGHFLLPIAYL